MWALVGLAMTIGVAETREAKIYGSDLNPLNLQQTAAVLGYLALPFDLIPDVVPVVGYADDAIVVVLTLRSVVRTSGLAAVERHWPGTADGLTVVRRLSGL
jgi:uncharacterized membrane protein YkvA (DUF1232 family)